MSTCICDVPIKIVDSSVQYFTQSHSTNTHKKKREILVMHHLLGPLRSNSNLLSSGDNRYARAVNEADGSVRLRRKRG
jgi:hypothetical protein